VDETNLVPVVQRDISSLAYGVTELVALPGTPIVRWTMNNSSFFTNFQEPTMLMVEEGNSSYPTEFNVVSLNGTEDTVPTPTALFRLIKSGSTLLLKLILLGHSL
jgi:hypothetical protein